MDAGPSQAWALRSVGAILARVTYCIHADASFSRLQKRPIVSGALGVRVRSRAFAWVCMCPCVFGRVGGCFPSRPRLPSPCPAAGACPAPCCMSSSSRTLSKPLLCRRSGGLAAFQLPPSRGGGSGLTVMPEQPPGPPRAPPRPSAPLRLPSALTAPLRLSVPAEPALCLSLPH